MASGKECGNENTMTFGKFWDSEKMLDLYIYNYMKEEGFHDSADKFAKEANLEMFRVLDSDKGLLKKWWELLWPHFFEQPSMEVILAIVASLEKQGAFSSQNTPVGIAQHNVVPTPVTNQQMIDSGGSAGVNVMEQTPANLLQTRPVICQHRDGRRSESTDSDSILRKSLAPSPSPSNLHLPVNVQSPVQVTGGLSNDAVAERSNQMDSNRLGQNSAYPPPGLYAGLSELSEFLKK